jgi:hypothetical protein
MKFTHKINPDQPMAFYWESAVTRGDEKCEVVLPNWVLPMAEALCRKFETPVKAASHIRNGIEWVYQATNFGDGYTSFGCLDFTISEEQRERDLDETTDHGRIKAISPAEQTLAPLMLALYRVVTWKIFQ